MRHLSAARTVLASQLRPSSLRLLFVAVAAALVILSVSAAATTVAMTRQIDRVSFERAPVRTEDAGSFEFAIEHIIVDGYTAQLLYLSPLSDDAPRPPGMEQWPEPGQVLLSPALAAVWDLPGLTPVGTLSPDALARPDEMIGYAIPGAFSPDEDRWSAADDFGTWDLSARVGTTLYSTPLPQILLLLFLTVVLPSLVLFAAAVASAAVPLRHRMRILEALGARPSALRRTMASALLIASGIGALLATTAVGIVSIAGLRIGYLDYYIEAEYLRREYGLIAAGFATGYLLLLLFVWILSWPRLGSRRTRRGGNQLWNRVTGPVTLVAVFTIGMSFQAMKTVSPNVSLWLGLSIVSSIAACALLAGFLRPWVGRTCLFLAKRTSSASALIAGRRILADSGSSRYAAVIAMLILIVSQAYVVYLSGLGAIKDSLALQTNLADSVSVADLPRSQPFPEAIDSLPRGIDTHAGVVVAALGATITPEGTTLSLRLTGTIESLREFGITSEGVVTVSALPETTGELLQWIGGSQIEAVIGPVHDAQIPPGAEYVGGRLLVAAPADSAEATSIERELAGAQHPPLRLVSPGDDQVAAARILHASNRWFGFLGGVAAAMLSAAMLSRQTTAMDISTARTVPLAGASGRTGLSGAVVTTQTLAAVVLGSALGGAFGLATGSILTVQGAGAGPPYGPVSVIVATCAASALVVSAAYWWKGRSLAEEWNPSLSQVRDRDE